MGNQTANPPLEQKPENKRITFQYIAPIKYETGTIDVDDEEWERANSPH